VPAVGYSAFRRKGLELFRCVLIFIGIVSVIQAEFSSPTYGAEPRRPARVKVAPKSAPELLEEAKRHMEANRYPAALKDLNAAVRIAPDSVEAYRLRGIAYDRLGVPAKAIADLSKFIELKPRDPDGYILRGDARNFSGEHEAALEDYEKAIKLAPSSVPAYLGRGLALTGLHRYNEAIKDYQWVLALDRSNAEATLNMGIACKLAGRQLEAVGYLEKALQLEQDPLWKRKIEKWIEQIMQDASLQKKKAKERSPEQPAAKGTLW
jgi:tetratricopeptide (TPR) repeat protein